MIERLINWYYCHERTWRIPISMDFDELAPGEESGIEQEDFVPRWRIRRRPLPRARLIVRPRAARRLLPHEPQKA